MDLCRILPHGRQGEISASTSLRKKPWGHRNSARHSSSHPPLLCSAHVKIDSQYFHIVHKLQMYATETPLKVLVCHDHKPHGMQASLWFPCRLIAKKTRRTDCQKTPLPKHPKHPCYILLHAGIDAVIRLSIGLSPTLFYWTKFWKLRFCKAFFPVSSGFKTSLHASRHSTHHDSSVKQSKPPQTIKQYLLRCLIARLREASANSAAAAAAEAAL